MQNYRQQVWGTCLILFDPEWGDNHHLSLGHQNMSSRTWLVLGVPLSRWPESQRLFGIFDRSYFGPIEICEVASELLSSIRCPVPGLHPSDMKLRGGHPDFVGVITRPGHVRDETSHAYSSAAGLESERLGSDHLAWACSLWSVMWPDDITPVSGLWVNMDSWFVNAEKSF